MILTPLGSYSNFRDDKPARRKSGSRGPTIVVRRRPGHDSQGLLAVGGTVFACAIGRGGISAFKREGDGATPLAQMRVLGGFRQRAFPGSAVSRLPLASVPAGLGWCDATGDRNYNRPVRLPYPASAETMRRADALYDHCLVLDWNIRPRRRGAGSAIFLHIARPGFEPTEGCVAVSPAVMRRLLAAIGPGSRVMVIR